MKIIKILVGAGVLAMSAGVLGCGSTNWLRGDEGYTYPVQLSRDIPAAQAKLNVTDRDDGARSIELEVKHLAPPQAVSPNAAAYVVWIQPEGAPAENVGTLKVEEDRTAEFKVPTNYEKFEVFVTPEAGSNVQKPRDDRLMRASVNIPRRGTY